MSGCSSTTFVYNRLDTIIGWYIDDFVTLSSEQKSSFDARIDELLDWHRREELPRYVWLLTATEGALDSELSVARAQQIFEEANTAADRLQSKVLATLIAFGEELSPAQRQEFVVRLKARQEELKEEYLERDDEEFFEDNRDRIASNLSDYLGPLNRDQKALIAAGVGDFERLDALWIADRERWLTALEAILASDSPDWAQQIQSQLAVWRNDRSPEYLSAFENNTQVTLELLCAVVNDRTPKQDRRLRRSIASYRDDFRELIAEVEENPTAINSAELGL